MRNSCTAFFSLATLSLAGSQSLVSDSEIAASDDICTSESAPVPISASRTAPKAAMILVLMLMFCQKRMVVPDFIRSSRIGRQACVGLAGREQGVPVNPDPL